jgi:hypothetical protein
MLVDELGAKLDTFVTVVYAALCEVGAQDLALSAPAFINADGTPYLEFDTWDYPEGSSEFATLRRAEELGQEAVARAKPKVNVTPTE